MAAFKPNTSTKTYLPARRRLVRFDGSDAPPELTRRAGGGRRIPNRRRPRSFSGFIWTLLKRVVIISLAIAIFYGAKFLAEQVFFRPLTGMAPEVDLLASAEPELPELRIERTMNVARKIGRGDSFDKIARSIGLPDAESDSLQKAASALEQDPETKQVFQSGRYVFFTFNPLGALQQVLTEPEPGKQLVLEREDTDDFQARVEILSQMPSERIAVGIIESSFAAAANKAGVRYDVVDDLVDLFSDRVEFRKDFHVGDRFTVVYRDLLLSDGRPAGGSQILAAALEVNGEHLVAARYVGSDGKPRFFDEKGHLLGNAFLRYPLKFSRISSLFSKARFHPVLKFSRPHNGVDFAAPIGTPVRTIADGVVVMSGRNGGSGNMVKIKHSDRYSTAYLHLSSISKLAKKGARVRRGDVIGAVGMTGLATGPHLHFSFYDNDQYVDPLKMKLPTLDSLDGTTKIDTAYLKRVLFTLDHFQTVELNHFYNE